MNTESSAVPHDPSFNGGEPVRPSFTIDPVTAIAFSGDGSIYYATWGAPSFLARITADGRADPTFNSVGHVDFQYRAGEESRCVCVLVQADKKILVVGDTRRNGEGRVAIQRFHSSGGADLVFGTVLLPVLNGEYAVLELVSGCLQDDGKILVTFGYRTAGGGRSLLVRLTADGKLDPSFGENGVVTVQSDDHGILLKSVLVRDDKKIIVGGTSDQRLILACYTRDGKIDHSFADEGFAIYSHPIGPLNMRKLVAQADGKLVCAGAVNVGGAVTEGFVLRFNANGGADATFNRAIPVVTDFRKAILWNALEIQPDGKIVMTGSNLEPLTLSSVIGRLMPNGAADPSFSPDGWVALGARGTSWNLEIQGDKRIVAVGQSLDGGGRRTGVVFGLLQ